MYVVQIGHITKFKSFNTVKSKSSGTREKCLPNQYDAKDGESGNMRLRRGHQRKNRDLKIVK